MTAIIRTVARSLVLCSFSTVVAIAASEPIQERLDTGTLDHAPASTCDVVFLNDSIDAFYFGGSPTNISNVAEILRDSIDESGRIYRWVNWNVSQSQWFGNAPDGSVYTSIAAPYLKLCAEVGDTWEYMPHSMIGYIGIAPRVVMGQTRLCRTYMSFSFGRTVDDPTPHWIPSRYIFTLDSFGIVGIREYEHGTETDVLQGVRKGDRYIGIPAPVNVDNTLPGPQRAASVHVRSPNIVVDLRSEVDASEHVFTTYDQLGRQIVRTTVRGGGITVIPFGKNIGPGVVLWSIEGADLPFGVKAGVCLVGL